MDVPNGSQWTETINEGLTIWNMGLEPVESEDEGDSIEAEQAGSEDDADGETDSEFARSSNSSGSDEDADADGETDSEYAEEADEDF
jgi:hypothetical protein